MINKRRTLCLISMLLIACSIMSYIDYVISPDYYIKSAFKLLLFLLLPILYFRYDKTSELKDLFTFKKSQVKVLIILALAVFFFILLAYFSLAAYFDLSNITSSLESDIGVNQNNFIFVAFYIAIVNSFLEEFFFRGFAFLELKKVASRKIAMTISALFFSLYHIAMMVNWFDSLLLLLITLALFIGGIIFNLINEKYENIYASWFVHMFSNLAINTIGLSLFGII